MRKKERKEPLFRCMMMLLLFEGRDLEEKRNTETMKAKDSVVPRQNRTLLRLDITTKEARDSHPNSNLTQDLISSETRCVHTKNKKGEKGSTCASGSNNK
jgi:hypothetical protein